MGPHALLGARLAMRLGACPPALQEAAYAEGLVTRKGKPTRRGVLAARTEDAQALHLCTRCEREPVRTESVLPSGEELCDPCSVRLVTEIEGCRTSIAFRWE